MNGKNAHHRSLDRSFVTTRNGVERVLFFALLDKLYAYVLTSSNYDSGNGLLTTSGAKDPRRERHLCARPCAPRRIRRRYWAFYEENQATTGS